MYLFFFFFNDTATTEIYTLSLHDALPISFCGPPRRERISARVVNTASLKKPVQTRSRPTRAWWQGHSCFVGLRSEEHTSELQSRLHLVCRLLLEKKKNNKIGHRRKSRIKS